MANPRILSISPKFAPQGKSTKSRDEYIYHHLTNQMDNIIYIYLKFDNPSEINMWSKQQIQGLKQTAYSYVTNDDIRDHLSALNSHLNNYERQPLFHEKNRQWKQVESEADVIYRILESLQVGQQSLN